MAKVYQMKVQSFSQTEFDNVAHSILFADNILPVFTQAESGTNTKGIVVTSGVDSSPTSDTTYELLADDSRSEASIQVSTGKFVEGNMVAVLCPSSEAQSDLRNYMTFYATAGDVHLHVGICNTTQSQDYTPDIIANSRVIKMITPAQVKNLGL